MVAGAESSFDLTQLGSGNHSHGRTCQEPGEGGLTSDVPWLLRPLNVADPSPRHTKLQYIISRQDIQTRLTVLLRGSTHCLMVI